MENVNKFVIETTVSILDVVYKGRDIQRFWVLEEIARAPYFAFLSVLHFKESLGLRGDDHIALMKTHFEQTLNETEHLEYMESLGGADHPVDRLFAKGLVLLYYWGMVLYYMVSPRNAYHINMLVEEHAAHTYTKYLALHEDERIEQILQDEIDHYNELKQAMEMIKWKSQWLA